MQSHPIKRLIDAACERRPLTHAEVASRVGVSRETLYRVMRCNGNHAGVETVCGITRAAENAPAVLLRLMYNDLDSGALTSLPVRKDGDHNSFLADMMIPDRTMAMTGHRFVKTWALQNTGVVERRDRKLLCVDGEYVMARWVVRKGKRVLVPDIAPQLQPEKREVAIPRTPGSG